MENDEKKTNLFILFTLKEEDQNNDATPSNEDNGEIENVRVVVRVRPMDKTELDSNSENVVKVDKLNRCITVTKPQASASEPPKIYYFDNVFAEDSQQVCDAIQYNFIYIFNYYPFG